MITELNWFNLANYKNTGLKIGYRRVSGKVGLTSREDGVRGAWVEKRTALFKNLFALNYRIVPFSQGTDITKAQGYKSYSVYQKCDILMLEFGGTNLQFYKKYWDETLAFIKAHQGRILFIIDDPDLAFIWKLLPDEDWSRWTILANATNPEVVKQVLKAPAGCKVVDYNMKANTEFSSFHDGQYKKLVYIGRPNGRTKYFDEFIDSKYLQISGKDTEWKKYAGISIMDIPQQRNRRQFYQNFAGCLAICDDKHRSTGWRTGRAYHALYAGIPVFAPKVNDGLDWCQEIKTIKDIELYANASYDLRKSIWQKQKEILEKMPMQDPIKL